MYCGDKTGQTVNTVGDLAVITFHSDSSVQKGGFFLSFTAVPIGECDQDTRSIVTVA